MRTGHFAIAAVLSLAGPGCGQSSSDDGTMMMMPEPMPMPPACSPEHPDGVCPADQRCAAGACVEIPECARDSSEPNDAREMATPLPVGTTLYGKVCVGDADWYRVDVPAGQLVLVLATFPWPLDETVNLDAYAYRADGTPLGGRSEGRDPNPAFVRAFETDEEGFGFYGGDVPVTYYVKVVPMGATSSSDYQISASATPWKDGATCLEAGFTSRDCTGGKLGAQTLWMFPFADAAEPFVGAGYMNDSVSNYRYLRRETTMLVRYAIHEVQRQFPGTHPLGFADMCQRDALTPGNDIGGPRHPATSHDQGGNIDVAFYQTLPDNHVRVVCDANGGSQTPDGWYCLPSAAMTHVVDLPRTAYFLAALARSPRFRAAGVDRVLGPLIVDEARRLLDAGTINSDEYDGIVNHLVWGDGWPAHHHHLHLSLQWL